MDVLIREARLSDAPQLAILTTQLGYPATTAEMEERLPSLLLSSEHLVAVAADGHDRAVGWMQATERRVLESPPFVQIAGLVVLEECRGAGIGAQLLRHAEEWARRRGVGLVRLRSNVQREEAHRFYLGAGYSIAKTSHLFVKPLAPEAGTDPEDR